MIIEQIWTANLFRNFNYLIACPATGEALAIDHTGGNRRLAARTGARIATHWESSGSPRRA